MLRARLALGECQREVEGPGPDPHAFSGPRGPAPASPPRHYLASHKAHHYLGGAREQPARLATLHERELGGELERSKLLALEIAHRPGAGTRKADSITSANYMAR